VPHDVRDLVVDFVRRWSGKAEIGDGRFVQRLTVTASKFYDWRERYPAHLPYRAGGRSVFESSRSAISFPRRFADQLKFPGAKSEAPEKRLASAVESVPDHHPLSCSSMRDLLEKVGQIG